jgi:sugar phosphate permease
MMLALVGAPLGGYIIDRWRKTMPTARMIYPAISTLLSALLLFLALYVFDGTMRIVTLFIFGIFIMQFISGAAAVTQDVIHPGLRATSYSIAVLVQNLLGSFTAPIALGRISDLTNIQTAVSILPFSLVLGGLLFLIGARYYVRDLKKVAPVKLEVN